jgi:cob(I)alamin adenosyltransferase
MKRILIFTGDGKGKTSAALGAVLRAAGHGWRSLIVQFLKSDTSTGEIAACRFIPGVEIVQMGLGFVPPENHPHFAEHRKAALDALAFTERSLASGKYDLVVLDEICGALAKHLIDEERVLEIVELRSSACCIILTGRNAGPRLIERADTVTEMHCVRHALQHRVGAQLGVEY